MSLTIGLVLPDVLGTYGDDGNALVLRQRARMRGIEADIHKIYLGDPVPTELAASWCCVAPCPPPPTRRTACRSR